MLRPFIVEKRNDEVRNPRLFDAGIGEKSPPRLIEGSEPRRLVVTEAMIQVRATARNVHSGSLGISGPRGVGKSTILQFFGTDAADGDDGDLRLVVPAPVDYEPREFIIHLFSQLCEAVPHGPADLSAVAAETRRHLEQLRYLQDVLDELVGVADAKGIPELRARVCEAACRAAGHLAGTGGQFPQLQHAGGLLAAVCQRRGRTGGDRNR